MNTNDDPQKAALAAFISAATRIKNPLKDATNPFHKNRYATLGQVIDTVKSELLAVGIVVVQDCRPASEGLAVRTRLLREGSGIEPFLCGEVYVPLKEHTPQGGMGAFTYGRRYGLLALLNLAAEDDDGNEASAVAAVAPRLRALDPEPEESHVPLVKRDLASILGLDR